MKREWMKANVSEVRKMLSLLAMDTKKQNKAIATEIKSTKQNEKKKPTKTKQHFHTFPTDN